jgi:hypothetical protein
MSGWIYSPLAEDYHQFGFSRVSGRGVSLTRNSVIE